MLVYGASQLILIVLWLLDWAFWKRLQDGEVRPLNNGNDYGSEGTTRLGLRWADYLWYLWFLVAASLGLFTSVGGTG